MDLLADRGVRARIFNANASSVMGELPFEVALPQVWVEKDDDAGRARGVIDDFMRAPAATGPARRCPGCAEDNPPSFDLCWSCGTGLEGCA